MDRIKTETIMHGVECDINMSDGVGWDLARDGSREPRSGQYKVIWAKTCRGEEHWEMIVEGVWEWY